MIFPQTAYANIDISSHWCNFRGRKGVGGEWLDFVMLGCDAGDAKNAAELKKRGAEISSD